MVIFVIFIWNTLGTENVISVSIIDFFTSSLFNGTVYKAVAVW